MPLSDRFQFHIGDSVQDRQTGEQGRVLNIVKIAGDAVLLSVGIYGAHGLKRTVETTFRPGQVAGTRFEKVVPRTAGTSAGTPQIPTPAHGGHTASQNQVARVQDSTRHSPFRGVADQLFDTFDEVTAAREATQAAKEQLHSTAAGLAAQSQRLDHLSADLQSFGAEHRGTALEGRYLGAAEGPARWAKINQQAAQHLHAGLLNQDVETLIRHAPDEHLGALFYGVQDPKHQTELGYRYLKVLRERQKELVQRQQQVDDLLHYLTGGGIRLDAQRPDGSAVFRGSYLSDFIFNRQDPLREQELARGESLQQLLASIQLDGPLRQVFGDLVGPDSQNLRDVLAQAELRTHRLGPRERTDAFRSWAQRLARGVREHSPEYQSVAGRVALNQQELDRVSELYGVARAQAGVESALGGTLNVYDIGTGEPSMQFMDGGRHPADTPYAQFHGQEPGVLDVEELRRRGQQIEAGSWSKRTGVSGNQPRLSERGVNRNPLYLFETQRQQTRLVQYAGQTYEVVDHNAAKGTFRLRLPGNSTTTEVPIKRLGNEGYRVLDQIKRDGGKVLAQTGTAPSALDQIIRVNGVAYRISDITEDTRTARPHTVQRFNPGGVLKNRKGATPASMLSDPANWQATGAHQNRRMVRIDPVHTDLRAFVDLPLHEEDFLASVTRAVQAPPEQIAEELTRANLIAFRHTPGAKQARTAPVASLLAYLQGETRVAGLDVLSHYREFGYATRSEFQQAIQRSNFASDLAHRVIQFQEAGLALKLREGAREDRAEILHSAWDLIHEELTHPDKAARYQGRSLEEIQATLRESVGDHLLKTLRDQARGRELTGSQLGGGEGAADLIDSWASLGNGSKAGSNYRWSGDYESFLETQAAASLGEVEARAYQVRARRLKGVSTVEALEEAFPGLQKRGVGELTQLALEMDEILRDLQVPSAPARRKALQRLEDLANYDLRLKILTPAPGSEYAQRVAEFRETQKRAARQAAGLKAIGEPNPLELSGYSRYLEGELARLRAGELAALQQGQADAALTQLTRYDLAGRMQGTGGEIGAANEHQLTQVFNAVLDLAEAGNHDAIHPAFRDLLVPGQGGKYSLRLRGEEGDLLYRTLKTQEGVGGVIEDPSRPHARRFLGAARGSQILTEEDLLKGQWDEAWLRSQQRYGREVSRSLQKQSLAQAVQTEELGKVQLGVYRNADGKLIGHAVSPYSDFGTVAENTRKLAWGDPESFLSLDIESYYNKTGPRHARDQEIYEVSIGRYTRNEAGEYVRTGTVFHGAQEGAAALQHGARQYTNEQSILQEAMRHLEATDELVVGHNIANFDLPRLIKRAGGDSGLGRRYQEVARTRLADTLLAAHAAWSYKQYDLESLAQRHLNLFTESGALWKEAHIALADEQVTGQLTNVFRRHAAEINAALEGATQLQLQEGQLFFNRVTRRAYQLVGVVDPEKGEEALAGFHRALGQDRDGSQVFGLALRELDTRTGQAVGPTQLDFFYSPRSFAEALQSRYEPHANTTTLLAEAGEAVEDLGRRRVRRFLGGENGFQNYLKEEGRYQALQGLDAAGGDLRPVLQDLANRHAAATSEVEEDLLASTFRWAQGQLPDPRIRHQLALQEGFWQGEATQHGPVVDWLKRHVEHQQGSAEAWREADALWEEYQAQLTRQAPWSVVENVQVPERQRQISVELPVLSRPGKEPVRVGIKVATPELVREDLNRHTLRILDRLSEEQLHGLVGAELAGKARIGTSLGSQGAEVFFSSAEGQAIRQRVWQAHLAQALQGGGVVQVAGEAGQDRFHLSDAAARNLDLAVQEIHQQGSQLAQQVVPQLTDPLKARTLTPEILAEVQSRVMGGTVRDALARLQRGEGFNLTIQPRHGGPQSWVGKSFQEILGQAAAVQDPGQRAEFQSTLSRIMHRMTPREQLHAERLVEQGAADWVQQAAQVKVGPRQFQEFNPGAVNRHVMKAVDLLEEWAPTARGASLAVGALAAGVGMYMALKRPARARPEQREEGIASSEEEVERRKLRLQEQLQTHQLRVQVHGQTDTGIDHQELVDSVHQSLGQFFGQQLQPTTTQTDNRAKIDRRYLDRLAATLMK
jgi:hypothetical protein